MFQIHLGIDLVIYTKIQFSKIYCQFLIQKQYIPANRKHPVFLMVMNFYNRNRRFLVCYWTDGLPRLGHILVPPIVIIR